jgi:hypothetical protein
MRCPKYRRLLTRSQRPNEKSGFRTGSLACFRGIELCPRRMQGTALPVLRDTSLPSLCSSFFPKKGPALLQPLPLPLPSIGRMDRQDCVVFLRAVDGKIAFLREYFDPVRAARALNTPILKLES